MRQSYYLFFVCLIVISGIAPIDCWGQCSPLTSHTTDPQNPTSVNTWDWKNDDFEVWLKQACSTYPPHTTIRSPFKDLYSDNVRQFSLYEPKDFFPTNGWELVYYSMGSSGGIGNGVDNPCLILYNRHDAKLRVFVQVFSNQSDYSTASIRLIFDQTNTPGTSHYASSSLFAASEDNILPVSGFTKGLSIENPNWFEAACGYWLWQDIPTMYDPCTCLFDSKIQVQVKLVSTSTLSLEGSIYGGPNTGSSSDPTYSSFSKLGSDLFGSAKKIIKSGAELRTTILNNEKDDTTKASITKALGDIEAIGTFIGAIENPISILSGALKFLSGTTKESSMITQQKISLSGSILTANQVASSTFLLPGANRTGIDNQFYSVYNNILGNFNLLEKPTLNITHYKPPFPHVRYTSVDGRITSEEDLPDIIEFVPDASSIKLLINPASGITIKSFKVAFEYRPTDLKSVYYWDGENGMHRTKVNRIYKPLWGPVECLADRLSPRPSVDGYHERLNYSGMRVASWTGGGINIDDAVFTTPYVDASCANKLRLRIYNRGNLAWDQKVFCKVVLEYSVPGSDKTYSNIFSFKVKINDLGNPNNYYYTLKKFGPYYLGTPTSQLFETPTTSTIDFWSDYICDFYAMPMAIWSGNTVTSNYQNVDTWPQNLRVHTRQISYPQYALTAAYIDGVVTLDPSYSVGTTSINAPTIEVLPGAEINPGISLICDGPELNQYYQCGFTSNILNGSSIPSGFCSTVSTYDPWTNNRIGVSESIANLELSLWPSPAAKTLSIASKGIRYIQVVSLNGRVVYSQETPPTNNINVNISSLPSGMYLVKSITEGGTGTGKFIKE